MEMFKIWLFNQNNRRIDKSSVVLPKVEVRWHIYDLVVSDFPGKCTVYDQLQFIA